VSVLDQERRIWKEFGIFNPSKNSNNTNLKDHPERMKYKRLPKPVLYRNEVEET
jgi:hypothetical protein